MLRHALALSILALVSVPAQALCGAQDAVQQTVSALEYHFSSTPTGSWSAPNRAHNLRASADAAGVRIEPRDQAGWSVRLSTTSFGPLEAVEPLGPAVVSAMDNRLQLARGGVVEWFLNQESGIKQGWTLTGPAHGEVWLGLTVEGLGFRPAVDGLGGEFLSADGSVKLRATGLFAFDANGQVIPARYESGPQGLGILVNTHGATFPVTVDPLLTNGVWKRESDQVGAALGLSVSAAGDLNGDGISDLAVAAPSFDGGQLNEGAVFLFYGSNSGLAALGMTVEGNQAEAGFGTSVAGLGDLNNDGFGDLAIGAPGWDADQTNEGAVFVFLGSAVGPQSPAIGLQINHANAAFGQSVAFAGDVNRDGNLDLVVGAPFFSNGQASEGAVFLFKGGLGGISPLAPIGVMETNIAGARLGTSVAGANDLNADGYMDVVAGAPFRANGPASEAGAVYAWLGTSLGAGGAPYWSEIATQAGGRLGMSVAGVGDSNGDGYADIVAGAPLHDAGQADEGAAFLYYGGASGISSAGWVGQSNQAVARYGTAVSAAGDVNGDGYADLVVGVPNWDGPTVDAGCLHLYHGGANGFTVVPSQVLEGPLAGALFGTSVSAAGDLNNDGYGDVVVGAPSYSSGHAGEGAAYVHYGRPSSISLAAQWSGSSNQAGAEYGSSVAFVGDLNGDGFSDYIVSAYNFDLSGVQDAGRVYVYLGGNFSLAPVLAGVIDGENASDRFGNCVAAAGDVNRDGYSDFLVGARLADAPLQDAGKVYLYFGAASGFQSTPVVRTGDQLGAKLGHWVSGIGDVNGDGYADIAASAFQYDSTTSGGTPIADAGRVLVWHGGPAGISSAPNWYLDGTEAGQGFGSNVAPGGDVNRDGFGDLVVGSFRPSATTRGRASVYFGRFAGLSNTAAWTFELPQNGAMLTSATSVGDVNGDGYSDLALGSPNYTVRGAPWSNTGQVFLFYGGASGPAVAPSATLSEIQPLPEAATQDARQGYGLLATAAGDVNNDGYADLLVSADGWNEGETDEGKVFVYLGSAGGVLPGAYWTNQMDQDGSRLGISVSGGGDCNGDGLGDVLVGVYRYSTFGPANEGYAGLHCGNGDVRGGPSYAPRMRRLNDVPIAPGGGTPETSYKLVIDHLTHLSLGGSQGRGPVRLAWESKQVGASFTGMGLERGAYADSQSSSGFLRLEGTASWSGNGRMKWRSRFEYKSPLLPRSIWFSTPVSGFAAQNVRVQADCNNNQVPDELDQDLFTPTSVYPNCSLGGDGIPDVCQEFGSIGGGQNCTYGTAHDSDNDGILDGCEVMLGAPDIASPDCGQCSYAGRTLAFSDGTPDAQQAVDFNGNGIPDCFDIISGVAEDRFGTNGLCADVPGIICGGDGIIDSIQGPYADCDADGFNDFCLIEGPCTVWYCGRAKYDCNGNNILDSCDIASGNARDQYGWQGWSQGLRDVLTCGPDGVPDTCQYHPLVSDCDNDRYPDYCEINGPTSPVPDCNGNGVPDDCEWTIPGVDCNGNQVVDSCEIAGQDCDSNNRLDVCDIALGAPDVNGNGVIDLCETQATPYCFGDLSGTACPCGLVGAQGRGCPNSVAGSTGSLLRVEGLPSASVGNLRLVGSSMTLSSSVLYFQGTAKQSNGLGSTFGDGLRCAAGSVLRLGTTFNVNGASAFPVSTGTPIRVLGQIPSGGGVTRYYQAWYRDASATWCTASRFNLTNGVEVLWIP